MKYIKKLAAMLIATVMLCSGLCACGETAAPATSGGDADVVGGETIGTVDIIDVEVPDKSGEPVDSDLCVAKIEGLSENFVMGADISTVIALEESGVKFMNWDGTAEQDLFVTLAEAGLTCVRVRVWNDPFDANGNGYGGGNCTIETALEIGKRAKAAGLDLMVDFHYSDFWADPAKQQSPKAWVDLNSDERTDAIYNYTVESLNLLKDNGIDVVAVQVGNETTNALAGISNSWTRVCKMFNAGSKAVREVYPDAKVVLHFTDPQKGTYIEKADSLATNEVDYDIFASSYYPEYHGTLENLSAQFQYIVDTYGKDVMVAETAWGWTMEDGDGHGNNFGGSGPYPVSVQGQANSLAKLIEAMSAFGDDCWGVFYWEPAWVPLNNTNGLTGDEWQAAYDLNKAAWEQYGTGWASSYAGEYDAEDAGQWYGGCACDNLCLFDFDGVPLESLKTFSYVYTGTTAEVQVTKIDDITIAVQKDAEFVAPETVSGLCNDVSTRDVEVEWNADELAAVDVNTVGDYVVTGVAGGIDVKMTIQVRTLNIISSPGFEEENYMWVIDSDGYDKKIDSETPLTGSNCFHFWNNADSYFDIHQEVTVPNTGTYRLSASMQGGDNGDFCKTAYIYIKVNGEIYKADFTAPMSGWKVWETAILEGVTLNEGDVITVGMYCEYATNGWGTVDDFELCITD